jgi:hypothetical protein
MRLPFPTTLRKDAQMRGASFVKCNTHTSNAPICEITPKEPSRLREKHAAPSVARLCEALAHDSAMAGLSGGERIQSLP